MNERGKRLDKHVKLCIKVVGHYCENGRCLTKSNKQIFHDAVNEVRSNITGEDLVDKIVPDNQARHDDTLIQHEELKSQKLRRLTEVAKDMKPDPDVTQTASKDISNVKNPTKNPVIAGIKGVNDVYQAGKQNKSLLKWIYHSGHIIHLKMVSSKLIHYNPTLQKFLMHKYHNDNRQAEITETNIINQKRQEVSLMEQGKYKDNVTPMTYHEDPYLRIVLYASKRQNRQHVKNLHGVSLSTLSAHVIIRQLHYGYNPLEQHKYDLVHGVNTSAPINQKIIKQANQRAKIEKHNALNPHSKIPLRNSDRMWDTAQKLNKAKHSSDHTIVPKLNFNNHTTRRAVQRMLQRNGIHIS